ncbi:MAG: nuclear transport factor 2 family protein [bacterium]
MVDAPTDPEGWIMTPFETAMAFVDAINSKDLNRLADLMTADHKFIDGDGSEHSGKDRMTTGWKEHFELIPDLTLSISDHFEANDTVVLLGWSSGTIVQNGELKPENSWRVPSAWRVVIESGRIAVWQLYANQQVLREIYNRIKAV